MIFFYPSLLAQEAPFSESIPAEVKHIAVALRQKILNPFSHEIFPCGFFHGYRVKEL